MPIGFGMGPVAQWKLFIVSPVPLRIHWGRRSGPPEMVNLISLAAFQRVTVLSRLHSTWRNHGGKSERCSASHCGSTALLKQRAWTNWQLWCHLARPPSCWWRTFCRSYLFAYWCNHKQLVSGRKINCCFKFVFILLILFDFLDIYNWLSILFTLCFKFRSYGCRPEA